MYLSRLIALFVILLSVSLTAAAQNRQPNVIIIYTDDQGSVDAGIYGATDLETPNIDALAKRGVRFTQFYVPGNVSSRKGSGGMPPEQITIAEMMKEAGYATAHIGKWHLGYTPETMPNAQGFDHSFGHMGGCIDNYSHFFYWAGPNQDDLYRNGKEIYMDGQFSPDLMVEEASAFMENHKNEPFFIYYAMNNPHYPYQGDPEWLEKYTKAGVPYPKKPLQCVRLHTRRTHRFTPRQSR